MFIAQGVDSWLDRMDRGSSDGKNRGVEPPPPSRSKADGKVAASVQSPLGPGSKPVQVAFVSPWKEKKGGVLNFGDAKRGTDAFVALAVVAPADYSTPEGGVASVPQAVLLEAMLVRRATRAFVKYPASLYLSSSLSFAAAEAETRFWRSCWLLV
jgi:hypothetical protein